MMGGVDAAFWAGKRVFVTGHTGFKGGWLTLWLTEMGAEVTGYALDPSTDPNMLTVCGVAELLVSDQRGDVRDLPALVEAVRTAEPEIVLHLAAQPLVRASYAIPVETYQVNVMGTVHVLEAVREVPSVKAVVNVTTDKCYENREWVWPYREGEAMGGADPYSSSKGCSELVTSAYRKSFLSHKNIHVASARAGNVIGGGDWSADRLLPDFLRATATGETLVIRSPTATRPWQHVLEPLSGYLALAQALYEKGAPFAEGWNFGPDEDGARSVRWIIETLLTLDLDLRWELDARPNPHEAMMLSLSSAKAKHHLNWKPRWELKQALKLTLDWHRAWRAGKPMRDFSLAQIAHYQASAVDE